MSSLHSIEEGNNVGARAGPKLRGVYIFPCCSGIPTSFLYDVIYFGGSWMLHQFFKEQEVFWLFFYPRALSARVTFVSFSFNYHLILFYKSEASLCPAISGVIDRIILVLESEWVKSPASKPRFQTRRRGPFLKT